MRGKYTQSTTDYRTAELHLQDMADMLSKGTTAQCPNKFSKKRASRGSPGGDR